MSAFTYPTWWCIVVSGDAIFRMVGQMNGMKSIECAIYSICIPRYTARTQAHVFLPPKENETNEQRTKNEKNKFPIVNNKINLIYLSENLHNLRIYGQQIMQR
jgi:hypothetical protein